MSLISLEKVQRHFGADLLFEDLDLVVSAGDRVGIVGANGSGKTSLIRLVAGIDSPDKGNVHRAKSVTLGYVTQHQDLDPKRTAWEETLKGLEHVKRAEARLRELEQLMATTKESTALDRLVLEHGRLLEVFERGGGYNLEGQARSVLAGLGLALGLHDQPTGSLSGGERARVALARVLLMDPDVLVLDEPTNHLDLEGTEWLEDHVTTKPRALLVISHDRRFLDRVTNRTLAFEAGSFKVYPGSYSTHAQLKEEEFKALASEIKKQQDFIRKERSFIRQHLGTQRSREAKGRQKRLERLELLILPARDHRTLKLDLSPARRAGNVPLTVRDLAAAYDDRVLFRDLNYTLVPGARLGIVGSNGSGKSTLLKILAGRLAPRAGTVDLGRNVDLGYYDQELTDLPRSGTVYQSIHDLQVQWTDFEVRSFLARMLFFEEDTDRSLEVLSGGERARVALGRLILRRPNMLFLDEPTNHLDIPARQALEGLLMEYRGTLVVVSHDRWFLDQVVDQLLWVDTSGIRAYTGNYTTAADRRRAAAKTARQEAQETPAATKRKKPTPEKIKRRPLARIEADIIAREEEKTALLESLADPDVYRDGARVRDLQERITALTEELTTLESEWESYEN